MMRSGMEQRVSSVSPDIALFQTPRPSNAFEFWLVLSSSRVNPSSIVEYIPSGLPMDLIGHAESQSNN